MKKSKVNLEEQLIAKHWKQFIAFLMLSILGLTTTLGTLILQPDFSELFVKKEIDTSRRTMIASENGFDDKVVDGIHLATGMPYDERFPIVKATCTACHSSKLVTQNRATREGWKQMIDWMQETQGLWELGGNEPIILDYLAEYYAPKEIGRRAGLEDVEYYILELD